MLIEYQMPRLGGVRRAWEGGEPLLAEGHSLSAPRHSALEVRPVRRVSSPFHHR